MRKLPLNIKSERRLKSLTGLDFQKYELLLETFSKIINRKRAEKDSLKKRKRRPGGGRKDILETTELKLLFVLYYLKAYPTFDVLADRFGFSTSRANRRLHELMPFLQSGLTEMGVMPKRSFESPEELQAYLEELGGIEILLIDVTEREHFRYQEKDKRDALYSGKKKVHHQEHHHFHHEKVHPLLRADHSGQFP